MSQPIHSFCYATFIFLMNVQLIHSFWYATLLSFWGSVGIPFRAHHSNYPETDIDYPETNESVRSRENVKWEMQPRKTKKSMKARAMRRLGRVIELLDEHSFHDSRRHACKTKLDQSGSTNKYITIIGGRMGHILNAHI